MKCLTLIQAIELSRSCLPPSPVLAAGEGEITWLKDDDDITDIVSKVDESSSRLSIKKAKFDDAGRYTCQCEFDNGDIVRDAKDVYVYGM